MIMESNTDEDFTFKNKYNVSDWDLDEALLSEGCTANEVQNICMLKENMNNVEISTRKGVKRIECKVSSCELETSKHLECEHGKGKKNSTTTACSYKKSRNEEIRELLRCCAIRRKESPINVVQENKRINLLQTKKARSHIAQIAEDDFITMKQIPSIN